MDSPFIRFLLRTKAGGNSCIPGQQQLPDNPKSACSYKGIAEHGKALYYVCPYSDSHRHPCQARQRLVGYANSHRWGAGGYKMPHKMGHGHINRTCNPEISGNDTFSSPNEGHICRSPALQPHGCVSTRLSPIRHGCCL